MRVKVTVGRALLFALLTVAPAEAQLGSRLVGQGLGGVVALVLDPVVPDALLILNKDGLVRMAINGAIQPVPFLDLRSQIRTEGERGLLHLAFAPDTVTGRLFVSFSDLQGDTVVARFTRPTGNPLIVDVASRFDLQWPGGARVIPQPTPYHHGGQMIFGADGYLHIALGDGGSAGDLPSPAAQQPSSLLGKMIRIDVNVADAHPTGYVVPPGNPFVATPGVLPEIWSFGFRNPWRWSIDDIGPNASHARFIGDVGEASIEELDYEPANAGGRNYGWPVFEGTNPTPGGSNATLFGPATPPVFEYGRDNGRSIIGGFVYRGTALPSAYQGRYFFGDFGSGRVWSAGPVPGAVPGPPPFLLEHTAEVGGPIAGLSSFARDLDGELYLLSVAGVVRKIAPLSNSPAALQALVSGSLVRLNWTPGAGAPPTGYVIEAGTAPGLADITQFAVGAVTELEVPGVPPGRYHVRVRALGAGGLSAPSPEAVAYVGLGCTAPPAAPAGLESTLNGRRVTLTWTAPEAGVNGYVIEAGSVPGAADVVSMTLGAAPGLVVDAPPGTYHVGVRAITACGTGPRSGGVVVIVS